MLARDIMTSPVIAVTPGTRTRDAIELMLSHHLSGLPVMEEGRLVGMLSEGDCIRRSELGAEKQRSRFIAFLIGPGRAAQDYARSNARFVRGIMTPEVVGVGEETPIEEVVAVMEKHAVKRLPVLRGEEVVGMLTRSDLLRALCGASRRRDAAMGDEDIKARILDELAHEEWAPTSCIDIAVKDGVVELAGSIFDARQRLALKAAVENTPGVKALDDRLAWIDPATGLVVETPEETGEAR